MTSKDNRNKAEIIADLNQKEQLLEQREKELEASKAKLASEQSRADRLQGELEEAIKRPKSDSKSVATAQSTVEDADEVQFVSPHMNYRYRGLQFQNHRFVTRNSEQIRTLRSSPALGDQFSEVEAA